MTNTAPTSAAVTAVVIAKRSGFASQLSNDFTEHLAVTRGTGLRVGSFAVTHRPTGWACLHFKTRRAAIQAMHRIQALDVPWATLTGKTAAPYSPLVRAAIAGIRGELPGTSGAAS